MKTYRVWLLTPVVVEAETKPEAYAKARTLAYNETGRDYWGQEAYDITTWIDDEVE